MATKRVNLEAVIGMLQRAERFDDLTGAQQAALRAQVTRTLKATTDPDIRGVLETIQDVVGTAVIHPAERMTAADLQAEYDTSYGKYNARQRAAFKAKVSRLGNTAAAEGDTETATATAELSDRIATDEEAGQRDVIRRLSEQLRK